MIDTPTLLDLPAQPTAVIHITVPRAEIRTVMGPGYQELMRTLGAQGIEPTGRWFTHHFKIDPAIFDLEIGVPVARAVTPDGRVEPSQLPAARVARTIYRGDYEGLGDAWGELERWISSQGLTSAPGQWETYVTDPASSPDPSTWCTELTRPLV